MPLLLRLVSIEVNFTDEDLDYNELGGNITLLGLAYVFFLRLQNGVV